jgi:SAM-dependent methyltransferase
MLDRRMAGNRATYDEIGVAYAELNRELPQSVSESMDRFVTGLPPGALVADVGCGPGRDLAELRARGLAVVGFDLSLGMLRAGGHPGVAQGDLTRLPVQRGSLDGLWCAAALLHIPRERVAGTLDGFGWVLHAGGALHLSVQEGTGEEVRRAAAGRTDRDLFFVRYEEHELRALLQRSGFTITSVDRSEAGHRWLTLEARLDHASSAGTAAGA